MAHHKRNKKGSKKGSKKSKGSEPRSKSSKLQRKDSLLRALEEQSPYTGLGLMSKEGPAKSPEDYITLFAEYQPRKALTNYMSNDYPFMSISHPMTDYGLLTKSSLAMGSETPEMSMLLKQNRDLVSLLDQGIKNKVNITDEKPEPVLTGGQGLFEGSNLFNSLSNLIRVPTKERKTLDQVAYTGRPDNESQARSLAESQYFALNAGKEGIDPGKNMLFIKNNSALDESKMKYI